MTDYVTLQEVAEMTGLRVGSLKVYGTRGTMPKPVRKFGTTPVWERDTIEEWLVNRPGMGRPRKVEEPIVLAD